MFRHDTTNVPDISLLAESETSFSYTLAGRLEFSFAITLSLKELGFSELRTLLMEDTPKKT